MIKGRSPAWPWGRRENYTECVESDQPLMCRRSRKRRRRNPSISAIEATKSSFVHGIRLLHRYYWGILGVTTYMPVRRKLSHRVLVTRLLASKKLNDAERQAFESLDAVLRAGGDLTDHQKLWVEVLRARIES